MSHVLMIEEELLSPEQRDDLKHWDRKARVSVLLQRTVYVHSSDLAIMDRHWHGRARRCRQSW